MLLHPNMEEAECRGTCIRLSGGSVIPHVSQTKDALVFERDKNAHWESREVL